MADTNATNEDETNAAVATLKREKHIVAVEPIRVEHELRAPNDPLLGELHQLGGKVAGKRWVADLVGHEREFVALCRYPQHRLDHVVAMKSADP